MRNYHAITRKDFRSNFHCSKLELRFINSAEHVSKFNILERLGYIISEISLPKTRTIIREEEERGFAGVRKFPPSNGVVQTWEKK